MVDLFGFMWITFLRGGAQRAPMVIASVRELQFIQRLYKIVLPFFLRRGNSPFAAKNPVSFTARFGQGSAFCCFTLNGQDQSRTLLKYLVNEGSTSVNELYLHSKKPALISNQVRLPCSAMVKLARLEAHPK